AGASPAAHQNEHFERRGLSPPSTGLAPCCPVPPCRACPEESAMRCMRCGWIAKDGQCPCGNFLSVRGGRVPVGTRVLARPGRGPSMLFWEAGEVQSHADFLHRVHTPSGDYWCELDDLLPDSAERAQMLAPDTRV